MKFHINCWHYPLPWLNETTRIEDYWPGMKAVTTDFGGDWGRRVVAFDESEAVLKDYLRREGVSI